MKGIRLRAAVMWLTASAGLAAWAVLFSANYLNASVEAYGAMAQHLDYLRTVLWRYLAVGGSLFAAWTFFGVRFWRGWRRGNRQRSEDSVHRHVRAGLG